MNISEYYRWLKKDWAKAGLILSIFLLLFLFAFVRQDDFVLFIKIRRGNHCLWQWRNASSMFLKRDFGFAR